MGLLSKLFGGKDSTNNAAREGKGTCQAETAIRDAHAGRISVPEMLRSVIAAQVYVPLAGPPVVEGGAIARWMPATVTKQADGKQFLLAFTDPKLMTAFCKNNPQHSYGFLVEAMWVLDALPPGHGIAFNLGSDGGFEWDADGIDAYRSRQ